MRFASASIEPTEGDLGSAIDALLEEISGGLEGAPVDLALVFMTSHYVGAAANIAEAVQEALEPHVLLGASGEGVVGRTQEIERVPALSLLVAHLPEAELHPFALYSLDWEETMAEGEAFRAAVGAPDDAKLALLLADPFSTPLDGLLDAFNAHYEGLPVAGGAASAGNRPGSNALLLDGEIYPTGAVGVALSGELDVDVIVSQGCRPIGDPLTITNAQRNVILELDGRPPLEHMKSLLEGLPPQDRKLLNSGLFVGRTMRTAQDPPGRGDFLIRGVMGIDPDKGAIAIGDLVETGETIQFHLRDASTAQDDLEMLLAPQTFYEPADGGLLFTCNGRGQRLYDHPDGDISVIQNVLGDVPVAGFFAAGEIGPVGGENFLHGQTASLVLFRSTAAEDAAP